MKFNLGVLIGLSNIAKIIASHNLLKNFKKFKALFGVSMGIPSKKLQKSLFLLYLKN